MVLIISQMNRARELASFFVIAEMEIVRPPFCLLVPGIDVTVSLFRSGEVTVI
jgi:hypothetical protein